MYIAVECRVDCWLWSIISSNTNSVPRCRSSFVCCFTLYVSMCIWRNKRWKEGSTYLIKFTYKPSSLSRRCSTLHHWTLRASTGSVAEHEHDFYLRWSSGQQTRTEQRSTTGRTRMQSKSRRLWSTACQRNDRLMGLRNVTPWRTTGWPAADRLTNSCGRSRENCGRSRAMT